MNAADSPMLPKGWTWTKLGDVCQDSQYGWTTSSITEGKLHLLRTTDITSGNIDWNTVPFCKEEPPEKEKYLLKEGDIVISRAGSVGYSQLIRNPRKAIFASYLIRFRPLIDEKYLTFFLKSPSYWNAISEKSLGIAIPNVNASKLKQITLPLPPLPEQRRIVSKLEELFSDLDAGVQALKKAKIELKRYRQSILKSAFEGKLTEDWRKSQKNLEPASTLLEHIREERKKSANGKTRELPPLDASDLPELPKGWGWTRLGGVLADVKKVNPKENPDKEFIYLDIASIDNTLQEITTPKKYVGKDAPSRARQLVKSGDILFSTVRTYLKNMAVVNEIYDEAIASTGFCVIRAHPLINNKLIFYITQTNTFLNPLNQLQRGTSYPAVRESDVLAQIIPLPSTTEQRKIIEEIERMFSVADETSKTIERSLKQAERLRQSILKKAFAGRLVPQDPTDEPAEKLLKRIREEKAILEEANKKVETTTKEKKEKPKHSTEKKQR